STSAPGRGRSRGSTRASAHRARASTEPPVRASDPAGGGSGHAPFPPPAAARTAAVRKTAGMRVPVLLLLNGAPGAGKSTLAARLAARRPLALALDIDQLKHSLGGWEADLQSSGLQARRLALALAGRHLEGGHDVLIGQYLARPSFLTQLQDLARECGARFV